MYDIYFCGPIDTEIFLWTCERLWMVFKKTIVEKNVAKFFSTVWVPKEIN